MPKEQITPLYNDQVASAGGFAYPVLHVGWTRGIPGVNVGVRNPGPDEFSGLEKTRLLERLLGTLTPTEVIGQTILEELEAVGRSITDEGADPHHPDHQVEFDAEFFGSIVFDVINTCIETRGTTSLWSLLERERVNDLIRLLRKARDQAFGADA